MTSVSAAKSIAISAVMAAILITAKFVIHFIPNVEVITPLIIIFTCSMGFKRTFFAVLVFCLADNLLYAFSYTVTIQYFIHWPLLCVLTYVTNKFFKDDKSLPYAFLALFSAILFWIETPLIESILQISLFFPRLYSGILFMLPMAVGGFVFSLLGFKPLNQALQNIKGRIFNNKN